MPIGSYLTALIKAKRARLNRSSIHSILLALDIEDGCRHLHQIHQTLKYTSLTAINCLTSI